MNVAQHAVAVAMHLRRVDVQPEQKVCLLGETGSELVWTLLDVFCIRRQ